MAKKKEWYMDYATHAFVRYANLKCPTREQYEARIREDCYRRLAFHEPAFIVIKANAEVAAREPLLKDIDAVNRVFEILEKQDKPQIAGAIRAVYFIDPYGKPKYGAVVNRVRRYAYECPANERTVYKWLKSARLLFCKERGLDTGTDEEKW